MSERIAAHHCSRIQVISVIVPTISGREESLARTLEAWEKNTTVDYELIEVKDKPTWPAACNFGAARTKGDIIVWGADDLDPIAGWHSDLEQWFEERDELPAPRIHNYTEDSPIWNVEDGPDGAIPLFTRVPVMSRSQMERIGPWPEQLIYYADYWVSEKGRTLGIETRNLFSYAFVHHWCQIGRVDTPKNYDAAGAEFNRLVKEMGR
jgi:hypothetical protein